MTLKHRKTELIELFSGFKNKKQKKMAQSKEISGFHLQSTLEIGVITVKRDLVFNITKTVINTKECGRLIKDMVRVHTGVWRLRNLDVNTQETGLKTRNMEEEHFSTKMEIVTTVIG
jgi:hypothetical protein